MGKHKTLIAVIAVVVVAAGAFYYFYWKPAHLQPQPAAGPQVSVPAEKPQPEEQVEPIQVELSKSDEVVRKLVKQLSSSPEVARWLTSDYLIRRFVSAVDLIANDQNPRIPMDFVELKGNFQVSKEDGQEFINPKSYQRYDRITGIIVALDTQGFVKLYKQLRLPIQQAYRELGYPQGDFNATFKKAILSLLATPVVDHRIYVQRDVLTYAMEDPALQDLTPAQKHLIRMGPDNTRAIQAKLRDIAQALGFLD
jgi:hypothetical protein